MNPELRSLGAGNGEIVVGLLTLSSILRGAFQNAGVGYRIDRRAQGAALRTAAVGAAVNITKDDLACTA